MLIQDNIAQLFTAAIRAAQESEDLPQFTIPPVLVERPKDPTHGDFAIPIALGLAREARMAPLKIAETILEYLPDTEDFIGAVSVAPPGFINLSLQNEWLLQQIDVILTEGDSFGRLTPADRKSRQRKVQVEFVSANPTGPFVVGSGRNAVLGDTLANVLEAAGYDVSREYYVNDIGTQIDHLAKALYIRYAQALGHDLPTHEEYQGDYLITIGQAIAKEHGDKYLAEPPENFEDIRYIMKFMRKESVLRIVDTIKADTAMIGVHFDRWFSEQSLYDDGTYELVYNKLKSKGLLTERDGAIWLRSDDDEDDKENVIVRSDGRPTYFASDIAYVWDKISMRKFDEAIYVWGADHHGHVKRLKNAAELLGLDSDKVNIILYQLVSITRDGEPVRQSKRSGDFITVREVVEEIGVDAFRFMLLTRSADSTMELDLELAKRESNDNPVYYVQYAHARIASIFRKAEQEGATMGGGDVNLLEHPSELALIRQILRLSETIKFIADTHTPHQLTYYAQELASAFHTFYRDCRVVLDDDELTAARLKLVKAAQIALANTLRLMGMGTPDRM